MAETTITSPEERAEMLQYLQSGEYSTEQEAWMMDQIEVYDADQAGLAESGQAPDMRVPAALGGFQNDPEVSDRNMDTYAIGLRRFGFNAQEAMLRMAKTLQSNDDALDPKLFELRQKRAEYLDNAYYNFAQEHGGKPSEFKMMMAHDLYLMPTMFFPASTMTRAGLMNSGVGGLASTVAGMETPGQTLSDASLGAAIGFGATYALGSVAGLRSYVGRQWMAEQNSATGQYMLQLEERIRRRSGNPDFTFSMSNIATDSPFLESLEQGAVASSRDALRMQRRNLQSVVDSIENDIQRIGRESGAPLAPPRRGPSTAEGPGRPVGDTLETVGPQVPLRYTPATIVDRLHNRMNVAGRLLQAEARASYGRGMNHLIDNYGDQVALDGVNYLENLESLLVENLGVGSGRVPAQLLEHINKVTVAVRPAKVIPPAKDGGKYIIMDQKQGKIVGEFKTPEGASNFMAAYNKHHGGISVEETVDIMKSHNELIAGKKNIFDTADARTDDYYGRFLKKSFLDNLTAKDGGTDAAQTILRINEQYAYDQARIMTMRDSYVGAIFGGDPNKLAANPTKALDELLSGNDVTQDTLAQTAQVLRQHAPELLPVLQQEYLKRVVQQGRNVASSYGGGEVDLDGLVRALSGTGAKSNVGRGGMGLFPPGEQQNMIDAAQALRALRNTYMKPGQRDAQASSKIQEAAINMTSRSAEFVARWLTRLTTSSHSLAMLMTDPRGRAALVTFAKEGPRTIKGKLASVYLAGWVGDFDATETERELEETSLKRQLGD